MRQKTEPERPEWETSNIGLMMFTSLMIILLAFFILLTSMAVIDEQRQIEAMGSVLGAFGILPGGQGASPSQDKNLAPPTSPMEEIRQDAQLIKDVLTNRAMEDKMHFLRGRNMNIISLESAMLFQRDGVEISAEMLPVLLEVAKILKNGDYPVVIEGHTDDQPPMTEAYKDNWEVSALRALNVLRFFVQDGGLSPKRLSAFGYAGFQPVAANINPRNRARNNRIDIVLRADQSKQLRSMEKQKKEDKEFDFKGFYFKVFGGGDKDKN